MYGQDDKPSGHPFDEAEEISEVSEPQGSTTTATGQVMPALPYAQVRPTLQPVNTAGIAGMAGSAPPYGFGSAEHNSPANFQGGWPPSAPNQMYSSGESVVTSANPSMISFDYPQYGEEQPGQRAGDQSVLFGGNYMASPTSDTSLRYSYGWDTVNPVGLGSDMPTMSPGMVSPGMGFGDTPVPSMGMTTPVSFTSASSSGKYAEAPSERASLYGSESGGGIDGRVPQITDARGKGKERRQPKRAKSTPYPSTSAPASKRPSFSSGAMSPLLPPTPAESAASGSRSAPGTKARRGSRSATSQPSSPREERKPRNTHNMVEKQYRNRLNAQFEGLMNALPETLRSQEGMTYGDTANDEGPDRRISKAEVLDMARRHIQSLEQERDELERDRNDLLETVTRLKDEYNAGGSA